MSDQVDRSTYRSPPTLSHAMAFALRRAKLLSETRRTVHISFQRSRQRETDFVPPKATGDLFNLLGSPSGLLLVFTPKYAVCSHRARFADSVQHRLASMYVHGLKKASQKKFGSNQVRITTAMARFNDWISDTCSNVEWRMACG